MTLRKTLKRASIYGVGATAMSVRGAASLFDHTFKGLLFIADPFSDFSPQGRNTERLESSEYEIPMRKF